MSRWSKYPRAGLIALAVIVLVLVSVRVALPHLVEWYAEDRLERPGYEVNIADVDLSLWRGAAQVQGLAIEELRGARRLPFFAAREIELALQWRELLNGAVVGELRVSEPILELTAPPAKKGKEKVEEPAREALTWQERAKELTPLRVNRFTVADGSVHFREPTASPPIDLRLNDLQLVATNLTNSRRVSETLAATLAAKARVMGDARLGVDARIDPFAKNPTFTLDAKLIGLDVTRLNDFLRAYAGLDVSKGTFDMVVEARADDGKLTGYVKPIFRDLDFVNLKQEKGENPLRIAWEAIVGTTVDVFSNRPRDQLATKIPISGRVDGARADVWATIGNLLENAFVRAFQARFEGIGRGDGKEGGDSS